jgi:hypothetical protein
MQCLDQYESEVARRSHLSDVERERLIFNEGAK